MAGSPKLGHIWRGRPPRMRNINFVLILAMTLFLVYRTFIMETSEPVLEYNSVSTRPTREDLIKRLNIERPGQPLEGELPDVTLDCPHIPENKRLEFQVV